MNLDIVTSPGNPAKPSIVFIHGLGMDKDIWIAPHRSRIMGGLFPLDVLIRPQGDANHHVLQTLYHDLRQREYPVVTWSQQRPAAPIHAVVPELASAITRARTLSREGVILIGHSRGGLIARKYLAETGDTIRCLMTIATPHRGSAIAKTAHYVAPLLPKIEPFIPDNDRSSIARALNRLREFLAGGSLQELLPESTFFRTLQDAPLAGTTYISAGGTNPVLFMIGSLPFPVIFEKVIPEHLYPDELKQGKGDGLVSAESSRLPWADEHYLFGCNHAEILFDRAVRAPLAEVIERIAEQHT